MAVFWFGWCTIVQSALARHTYGTTCCNSPFPKRLFPLRSLLLRVHPPYPQPPTPVATQCSFQPMLVQSCVGACDFMIISEVKVSKNTKDKPWHVEGSENAEWVLMDYVHVVVHVFQKHIREYYDIENLWGDAKITEIETSY